MRNLMRKVFLIVFIIAFANFYCYANIHSVEIFITHNESVSVSECNYCKIYYIDNEAHILQQVFGNLSNNEAEAYQQAMNVINSDVWGDYEEQLKEAQLPILRAWELGVKKYPAIVINQQFVGYGSVNIKQIIDDYNNYTYHY